MFKVADPYYDDDPIANADDLWYEFENDTMKLLRKYLDKFEGVVIQEALQLDTCSVGFTCLYTAEAKELKSSNLPPLSIVLSVDGDVYLIDPIDDFLDNIGPDDLVAPMDPDGNLRTDLNKLLQELKEVQRKVEEILIMRAADGDDVGE